MPAAPAARHHRWARWRFVAGAVALSAAAGLAGTAAAVATAPDPLLAVFDTFVNPNYPDGRFGVKPVLKVDDTPKTSFLTFHIPGRPSARSRSAVLRLHATPWSAPGTVTIHQVDTSFDEQSTTFRSAPVVGSALATGSVSPDGWLTVPLAVVPDEDGLVSFALSRSEPGRDTVFYSRESDDPPVLTIGPGAGATTGPAPSVAPTASPPAEPPRPEGTPSVEPPPVPPVSPAPPAGGPQSGPFLAYTPDSFFRTPLPDSAPVDPDSSRGIGLTKARAASPYPMIRGVDGNSWGMPFALASCSDPLWTLTGTVPPEVDFLLTQGFHAPAGFADALTGTSDSPLVVIDRCGVPAMPRGFTVWAARASVNGPHTVTVGTAGAFAHDSNGLDERNPRSDSDVNFRSRGAIPDAMVIRDDLLAAAIARDGDLGHVLHMFWWETDSAAGAVSPMVGAESSKAGFGAEGMRIRIKPEVDLAARACSPAGRAVARTLQNYGAYLGDNAGGDSTGLKAEQGSTAITADALDCLTWDDFDFVLRGWDASTG